MDILISNSSDKPIYEQITSQIKNKIIRGELPQGTALPSMRLLAKDLRISVITTKRAYSDLERGIYCFSTVALVFLLLMLEEGEIKELLSSLRDEIEKVEGREVA